MQKTLTQPIPATQVISIHPFAEVRWKTNTPQKCLTATQPFFSGQAICSFQAKTVHTQPTYLTVQKGVQEHITLYPEFLQYINHSCSPNVFFDTDTMQLIALKNIEQDDELCFFYPSTEWDMAQPFDCNCGYHNCLHTIQGAAHINWQTLKYYKLTHFILDMLEKNG